MGDATYEDTIETYAWTIYDKLDTGKITREKADRLLGKLDEWERVYDDKLEAEN